MQGNDTTIFNFGEQADDLMTELAAAGLHGMSRAQADLVVRMGRMLDYAARRFSATKYAACPLVSRAVNRALAMRMHGATLRGAEGAELLEDLCDALGGRYEPEDGDDEGADEAENAKSYLTVDEAMKMLELRFQVELARMLEVKAETVTQWKTLGYIPERKAKKIRTLHRGMLVMAAA